MSFIEPATMHYTNPGPAEVARLCRAYAPLLRVPTTIDAERLMWAIAGCESSFGLNCKPRHESAYDHGGFFGDHAPPQEMLLARYGPAAACSFGPWQTLFVNAGSDLTPQQLADDPQKCAVAFVAHMNRFVLDFRQARTVDQIAQTYNCGNFCAKPAQGVLNYAKSAGSYYATNLLPASQLA